MKKHAKKIIGITLCLIMCIAALTSCRSVEQSGMELYENSPDALVSRYRELGYFTMILNEESFDSTTFGSGVDVDGIEAVVTVEDLDNYGNYGYFFFCINTEAARENFNKLVDYNHIHEIGRNVIQNGSLVYLGSDEIIDEIYNDYATEDSSLSVALGMLIYVVAIFLIIAAAVILIAAIILLLLSPLIILPVVHLFITATLFVLVIVLAVVAAKRKKKLKAVNFTIEKQ